MPKPEANKKKRKSGGRTKLLRWVREQMRKRGFSTVKTEHWNAWAFRTEDMAGFIDLTVANDKLVAGIQVTTGKLMNEHVRKLQTLKAEDKEFLRRWVLRNELWIIGVRKHGRKQVMDCIGVNIKPGFKVELYDADSGLVKRA